MKETIELCNNDLNEGIFKDVMFFAFAEGGAMGVPGAVLFYDKTGQSYSFNYISGDIDIEYVEKELFPVLSKCVFGLCGINSKVPKGWHYFYLDMGHHLIVNDRVYSEFVEMFGDEEEGWYIYGEWVRMAENILNSNTRKHNSFVEKSKSQIRLINDSSAEQVVDVIVNAANSSLWVGGGICGVIFKKAGMQELTEACNKFKTPLKDGDVVVTPAFNLKNAKVIIHAVGPNFSKTAVAFKELFNAYYNSLLALKNYGYHSISFPLISAGIYGGGLYNPIAESTKQCCKAYKKFVEDYPNYEVDVRLCAFSSNEMLEAKKVFEEYFDYELHDDITKKLTENKVFDDEIRKKEKGAILYEGDDNVRFVLGEVGNNPIICFGVNPSTANDTEDDPTISKIKKIAIENKFDAWIMLNLYPQRSTDPDYIHECADKELILKNMEIIRSIFNFYPNAPILAAWGDAIEKRKYLKECLIDILSIDHIRLWVCRGELTAKKNPRHQLYVKNNTPLKKLIFDLNANVL